MSKNAGSMVCLDIAEVDQGCYRVHGFRVSSFLRSR